MYPVFHFVWIVHGIVTSPHHPVHRLGVDVPGVSLCVILFMVLSPAHTTQFTDLGWMYLVFHFVWTVHGIVTSPHHPVHRLGVDVPGVSLCVNCSWYCHQPTPPSSQTWGGCTWCFTLCELFMVLSAAHTTQFIEVGWSYLWHFTEVGMTYPVFHFVWIVHGIVTNPHHPVYRGGVDVPGASLCVNCSWYCHQPTPPSSQRWGGRTCCTGQAWDCWKVAEASSLWSVLTARIWLSS